MWRNKAQRKTSASLAYKQAAPIGIGKTRKQIKAKAERQYTKDRAICRQIVYDRARGCCEWCGRPLVLKPQDARYEAEIANIDEIVPRSKGGDPTDPRNCRCLCHDCHFSGPSGGHRLKDRT